jgi:hypothetical protein
VSRRNVGRVHEMGESRYQRLQADDVAVDLGAITSLNGVCGNLAVLMG